MVANVLTLTFATHSLFSGIAGSTPMVAFERCAQAVG
jgi:hypothetical protein